MLQGVRPVPASVACFTPDLVRSVPSDTNLIIGSVIPMDAALLEQRARVIRCEVILIQANAVVLIRSGSALMVVRSGVCSVLVRSGACEIEVRSEEVSVEVRSGELVANTS